MLPILDFFYGIVHSYGFAIIALTLIVRFALFPLSAGQIRSMRRMKIAQPAMQKKVKEVQERYKDDPVKQREEMSKVYQEYGNPLAGCLPLIVQMPILFALFATLRGSPFADVNYTFDIRAFPQEQVEAVAPEICEAKEKTLYIRRDNRASVHATLPNCDRLGIGQSIVPSFIDADGTGLADLLDDADREFLQPRLHIDKGEDVIRITESGEIEAIGTGDAAVTVDLPGLAKDDGFLFIEALGRIGATGDNGEIHWDIVGMVLF
ncbi:MAG: membrane protein insertase YidC, partial [Cyanobacteria bacterium J06641_5]